MAEPRKFELSDLLCFAINKFSRLAVKQFKSAILDFYSAEDITAAKELLQKEAEKLSIEKLAKLPRRRKDSINRVTQEIDDIINIIATVDEAKYLFRLPLFVSQDPDRMPSIKLTDGDLSVVLSKLDKLDNSLRSITSSLSETNQKLAHQLDNRLRDKNYIDSNIQSVRNVIIPHSSGVTKVTDNDLTQTSELSEVTDNDNYETVNRNRKRKKHNTPTNKDTSSQSFADRVRMLKVNVPREKAKIAMTGNSIATTSSLKASKTALVKKSVFCLNNIDCEYSENDVVSFIKSIGVNIFTCFELKSTSKSPRDRKAFRICIAEEHKLKLLDNNVWAVGITIRDWIRKGDRVTGESKPTDQPRSSPAMDYCDSDLLSSADPNPGLGNNEPCLGHAGGSNDGPTSDSFNGVISNV